MQSLSDNQQVVMLRKQIETMSAIARGREATLKQVIAERDGLLMALLKHIVIGRYQSGNTNGTPKRTGLRCLECHAESNEPAVIVHDADCIIGKVLNA